jgi:hypothetical protein
MKYIRNIAIKLVYVSSYVYTNCDAFKLVEIHKMFPKNKFWALYLILTIYSIRLSTVERRIMDYLQSE